MKHIEEALSILKEFTKKFHSTALSKVVENNLDPFKVLISCLLSLRTKDYITINAYNRLFAIADTPERMAKLPLEDIEKNIYPVGFYRKKSQIIRNISQIIVKEYSGQVPSNLDELLKLPGVGRKTANIVVTMAYKKPGIAVDTHVHRIVNRWGYVSTKNPIETEKELRKKLPQELWIELNDILVIFGQNICLPISPYCSKCPITGFCHKINLKKNR